MVAIVLNATIVAKNGHSQGINLPKYAKNAAVWTAPTARSMKTTDPVVCGLASTGTAITLLQTN